MFFARFQIISILILLLLVLIKADNMDPSDVHYRQMQTLANSLVKNDYKQVSRILGTATKLFKNGNMEHRPWNCETYIKKMMSLYKYRKVEIISSNSKTKKSSMMFLVDFEIEDLTLNDVFRGKEVLVLQYQGNSEEIITLDRLESTSDRTRELFPEIDFEFDFKFEVISDPFHF